MYLCHVMSVSYRETDMTDVTQFKFVIARLTIIAVR